MDDEEVVRLTDADHDPDDCSSGWGGGRAYDMNRFLLRACVQSIRRRTAKRSNVVDPPVSAADIIKEVLTALFPIHLFCSG